MDMRLIFVYLKGSSCGVSQNKGCPALAPTMLRLQLYLCYNSGLYLYKRSLWFTDGGGRNGLEGEGLEIGRLVGGPATRLYKASTKTNLDQTSITQRHSNLPDLKPRKSLLHPSTFLKSHQLDRDLNISLFQQTF